MPLPLIVVPIAIGGAALLTGGMTVNAQSKIKKAKAQHEAAYSAYKAKYEQYKAYHIGTGQRLQKLGQVRASGMQAVREAINFIRKARLVNPDIISDGEVSIEDMERLDQAYGDILKTLGGAGASLAGGVGAGALTALGAYGAVAAFGTASTGAAISGLSGAAASSAALAWFGGGSIAAGGLGMAAAPFVLSSIVAAPALIAFGVFRQVKAGQVQKEAAEKIQQIQVKEAEIGRDQAKLRAVRQRCYEIERTVRKLTGQLRTALPDSNPTDPEDVQRILKITRTLRAIIDEPAIPTSQTATMAGQPTGNNQSKAAGRRACPRCGKIRTLYRMENPSRLRCHNCRMREGG